MKRIRFIVSMLLAVLMLASFGLASAGAATGEKYNFLDNCDFMQNIQYVPADDVLKVFCANMKNMPSASAFTAHMDCVENCKGIEPVLEDGIFRSKGDTILGGDDKAGVTAILEGLHLMKEMYIPHGKITVIFTVQEEIGLFGSKNIEEK